MVNQSDGELRFTTFRFLQPIVEDIKKHEALYGKIMRDAKEILEDAEQSAERESLLKEVNDIKNRWNNVVAHAETRDGELARVLPEAKRCQTKVQSLEPKLADLENKLESLPDISVDIDALEKQSKDAEVLRKDADDLATLSDEMTDSCNTLVGNPLADLTVVAAEVESLKARYGAILDKLSNWQSKVNTVNEQVTQYNEAKKPIEETVLNVEETVPVHDAPVQDVDAAKSELEAVEKSIEALDALRAEKTSVVKIGSGILKEVGEESPKIVVFKEGSCILYVIYNVFQKRLLSLWRFSSLVLHGVITLVITACDLTVRYNI